jgi:polyhydroxybutyrate depolymerase
LLGLVSGFLMGIPTFAAAAAQQHTIAVDGLERAYLVYVPEKLSAPASVVFCLHGGGSNARQIERYTQFDALAAKKGFVVVYPESVDGNWNDGRGNPEIRAQRENIDDVTFLRAVLDDVASRHEIDRSCVFATGISNGGMMSHRLAADAPDMVAAIAPVAGGLPVAMSESFAPKLPVSILVIQGDADPIVPFDGGEVVAGGKKRGQVLPTNETIGKYVACNGNPHEALLATLDTDPADDTSVEIMRYPAGRGGARTELHVVKGGGHTWPGRPRYFPEAVIGKVSQDFSATEAIWEFFQSCPPRRIAAK